jgi:hypothetical protein
MAPWIIKINWNAGLDKSNGRVGLGMIAGDYKGFVLAARSITLQHVMEPIASKAMTAFIRHNIQWGDGLL